MSHSNTNFWKQKLAAFLHDPPSKCVDIHLHEKQAKTLYRQAGFVSEEEFQRLNENYAKQADWTASTADRFPFPKSRGNLSSVFDGVQAKFHHPLSPDQEFKFHCAFQSAELAMEIDENVQPVPEQVDGWSEEDQWKARFFCHWRLWEKFTTEKDYRFAFLPAETRLPDHSVWTHMQIVSALDSCADGTGKNASLKPAFLKFQLGPVQDFIAEARSIRDLWSGSYLLSWLMAAGMKALALEVGPDAVVFPNLKNQPVFDLHLRSSLWDQIKVNGKFIWKHLEYDHQEAHRSLLTPNLPNIFLAIVHRDRAEALGKLVVDTIRKEWESIASSVWDFCEKAGMIPEEEAGFTATQRKGRFDNQVSHFLSLNWQVTPWPDTLEDTIELANSFDSEMPIQKAATRVKKIIEYATQTMPEVDRDGRYYHGGDEGPKTKLNNIGLGWSLILAYNGWQLDAIRQTRIFHANNNGSWETGVFSNKDSLGGKSEAVAGGQVWLEKAQNKGGIWRQLFKHNDWLSASTLIKRIWHVSYLQDKFGLKTDANQFPMPNTYGIAQHKPFSSGDEENEENLPGEKYFAVLALDGDEVGKWVSGEKTPSFKKQFSNYLDGTNVQRQGALRYFEENNGADLLQTQRTLSPSYHLQFSQALSNFSLLCVRSIVEAHNGRLIYAGGDDVLAMLPADTALECSQDLRAAFQGKSVNRGGIISSAPGYLSSGQQDQSGQPISFIVPGPQAEVSVGLAIAHFKSPLQDVVRAAQTAEKHAKQHLKRAAIAISLFKRSGETVEWGTKWESGGLALYEAIIQALKNNTISSKFPHRICQLLEPYTHQKSMSNAENFNVIAIIKQEFIFAISRQSSPGKTKSNETSLLPKVDDYLSFLSNISKDPQILIQSIIGLCTTIAFIHRQTQDNTPHPLKDN